jgi:hypothetical protein
MAKFLIFLIKEPLAEENEYMIERPEVDSYRGFFLHSRAKVCPLCLTIWARIEREGEQVYGIEPQSCEYCNGLDNPGIVPGSLLDDRISWTIDMDLLDYLPAELIQREYYLHLKHFERYLNEQSSRSNHSTRGTGRWGEVPVIGGELPC